MPTIIDVWSDPGYVFPEDKLNESPSSDTRQFIRKIFGPELPGLFAGVIAKFGLDTDASGNGVTVHFHDCGEDDVNPAQVWIQVQFYGLRPSKTKRLDFRDAVFDTIVDAFHAHDLDAPKNLLLTVSWGTTNGYGSVNKTYMEW